MEPKWNLIFEIRSTRRCESAHEEGGWLTHQTRRMTHGRKENKCGGRSRINWKLANRECVTFLTHAYPYPSEDFGKIFRTRLENKVGTITGKQVLATAFEGHLNGRTPNPREGLLGGPMAGSNPYLRRRKVCIGPTRLPPPLPPFQPSPSSSAPPRCRLAKSPHLTGRCTCEAHACLPFSPFESRRRPACRLDQKGLSYN